MKSHGLINDAWVRLSVACRDDFVCLSMCVSML